MVVNSSSQLSCESLVLNVNACHSRLQWGSVFNIASSLSWRFMWKAVFFFLVPGKKQNLLWWDNREKRRPGRENDKMLGSWGRCGTYEEAFCSVQTGLIGILSPLALRVSIDQSATSWAVCTTKQRGALQSASVRLNAVEYQSCMTMFVTVTFDNGKKFKDI